MSASLVAVALVAGCAHGPPPAQLTPLGKEHRRESFRVQLDGTAVVLPVLDCTSRGVERIPNQPARNAGDALVAELWLKLNLPGDPDPDDAENLPERERLCRELSDNLDSGTNIDTASPHMRELLRDVLVRHSERSWVVVAARWLPLGERVPGTGPATAVGVLEGHRHETDFLEASLYVFSRTGMVAYRADLACRGADKGARHDCGAAFENLPSRVGELVDGFPRSIVERPYVVRTGGLIPARRPPDPVIDMKNPAAVVYPPPAATPAEPADGAQKVGKARSGKVKKGVKKVGLKHKKKHGRRRA